MTKNKAAVLEEDNKADAINEFLLQTSLGFTPHVAFERATDGSTTTPLRMPSNVTLVRRGA